jgi:Protein of unknown function (DUF4054)
MGSFGGGVAGTQNWPNFNAWLATAWGAGASYEVSCAAFYGATNLVFGQNPPYFLDDFKSIYPKFFGLATALSGCGTTTGSNVVTIPSTNGLDYGQFVQAWGVLPKGSIIIGIGDNEITLSTEAGVTAANVTLKTYQASPIPTGVLLMYLRLAYDSLVFERWQEMWFQAIGLFIAHYCTIYAQTDASEVFETLATAIHGEAPTGALPGTVYTLSSAPPGEALQSLTKNGLFLSPGVDYTLSGDTVTLVATTGANDKLYATWPVQIQVFTAGAPNGAQIAAQGLAGGIQTSKSVGDVSVSYQVLTALEDWGAWNLTKYGQLLATQARVIGMGPMVIY